MSNTFLHVDINAYFATMLQQENPHLRGKPIGIVKERKRTCVIASSKEAKLLGVQTGCSSYEAKRLAPNIIFVPAAFDIYLHATKKLHEIFRSFSPNIEVFSLDEAFLDISNMRSLYPCPKTLGIAIQEHIKKILGSWVTCNVGIGKTRLLAKISSEISPKGSVSEVTDDNMDAILSSVSFKDVCGVGRRLEQKLSAIGVTNPYLIRLCSNEELTRCVGPYFAKELRKISLGLETDLLSRIDKNPYMKSVGRSITGYKLCDNEEEIQCILYNLTEEMCHKARIMNMHGREVSIALFGERKIWSNHIMLKTPINQTLDVFHILYDLLYKSWKRSFKVIKFSVRLSKLSSCSTPQLSLFKKENKRKEVSKAVDEINKRFGLFTVRPALLTKVPLIRPEVTGFLGDKIFQLQ